MVKKDTNDFKNKILSEMMVNHSGALEKNYEIAKKFIRFSREGKIEVTIKSELSVRDQILMYLIGKLYAYEAGVSTENHVSNEELMNELGLPKGSVTGRLTDLRKENKIKQTSRGRHRIQINVIEKTLRGINIE